MLNHRVCRLRRLGLRLVSLFRVTYRRQFGTACILVRKGGPHHGARHSAKKGGGLRASGLLRHLLRLVPRVVAAEAAADATGQADVEEEGEDAAD